MKIFLTGARGDIGKAIKKELESNSIEVICPNSDELDLSLPININSIEVDGLIHCAGINFPKPYNKIKDDELKKLFNINTFSFLELIKQLRFKNGSNIIAIGSIYSTGTNDERCEYVMSKHALYGAVKTLALELSKRKIKVNLVSPGFVETKLTMQNNIKERIYYLKNTIPLGMTKATSIAKFCKFLVNENVDITGQNIIIDGGYSLRGI
jgi:NAD(P)-dependent dehydrogenase (short-subunit alcohol dehydrogenase family)